MDIKINSKSYTLENFSFEYTYSGLLSYQTSRRINEQIITRAEGNSLSNNYPSLLIKNESNFVEQELPPCLFRASFTSEPNDESRSASGLNLIWFGDAPGSKPITKLVASALGEINWHEHATDFDY